MLSATWRMQNIPAMKANVDGGTNHVGKRLQDGGRPQPYLVILVLDSKSLAQVPEHLRAVLLKFELPREILSKEQKVFYWISAFERDIAHPRSLQGVFG